MEQEKVNCKEQAQEDDKEQAQEDGKVQEQDGDQEQEQDVGKEQEKGLNMAEGGEVDGEGEVGMGQVQAVYVPAPVPEC